MTATMTITIKKKKKETGKGKTISSINALDNIYFAAGYDQQPGVYRRL